LVIFTITITILKFAAIACELSRFVRMFLLVLLQACRSSCQHS
jgi:hypothetical protein